LTVGDERLIIVIALAVPMHATAAPKLNSTWLFALASFPGSGTVIAVLFFVVPSFLCFHCTSLAVYEVFHLKTNVVNAVTAHVYV